MFIRRFFHSRSASIAVTAFGVITNFALAVQVISTWRSLKLEPESEWETSGDRWQVDGIKVIWGLLSVYFASAALVSIVGFIGIIRNKPTLIRFYRDYSIADFSFCTFAIILTSYAVFHTSVRAAICEELSRHPELMQDLFEMGLSLENCERWLERAAFAFVAFMFIIVVIRLHFLLAVSNLHSQLTRHPSRTPSRSRHQSTSTNGTTRRIYLLPPSDEEATAQLHDGVQLVYAPIPINSIPKHLRDSATEAWVSSNTPSATADSARMRSDSVLVNGGGGGGGIGVGAIVQQQEQHQRPYRHRRHSHSHAHSYSYHHRSRSSSQTRTGTIRLPVVPDEGLLPPYDGHAKV